jgi:hypothetical protein
MTLFSPYSSYLESKDIRITLFSRPLGRRRRLLALLAVGAGLLTFFVPLVTIDPPVLGITHWSAFNTVTSMYEGKLSQPVCERCGEPLIRSMLALPIEISVVYLLFGCALVALCFSESPKILAVLASIGSIVCLNAGYATMWAFEETFYGRINPSFVISTTRAFVIFADDGADCVVAGVEAVTAGGCACSACAKANGNNGNRKMEMIQSEGMGLL